MNNVSILFGEFSSVEKYRATARNSAKIGFKDIVGERVFIDKALAYDEAEGNKTILSCILSDGRVVSGDSKTTRESLMDMLECFTGDELREIELEVRAQQSKNGRTFITLQM